MKPAVFNRDEPADVRQYKRAHRRPHESTADQFFGESQFESYRALGEHIALAIAGHQAAAEVRTLGNVEELFTRARAYMVAMPGLAGADHGEAGARYIHPWWP